MTVVGGLVADPLICVRGLTKSFGAVRALNDVSIDFHRGRVHGLVGANGAGKSTLLNVLGGAVQPDAGTIEVDGHVVDIPDPRAAADLSFTFMWQELALVPAFSAYENMTLGRRATTFLGVGDRKKRRSEARAVASRLGLTFDLDEPVSRLSVAERGLVAIGRALVGDARFLSVDEPTASLSDVEVDRLFAVLRDLASDGVSVAYVSHRLKEIEDLCDEVTIFKDGVVVRNIRRGEYTRRDLILGITGARTIQEAREDPPDPADLRGEPVLQVLHVARPPRVQDVSFTLHRGEILGLAGVVGAGRTEAARIIFGADKPTSGSMTLFGRQYQPRSINQAIDAGVALVPEERRSQALVMHDSVSENIIMGNWKTARAFQRLPFIKQAVAARTASAMGEALSIRMRGVDAEVRTLSGGNQQKVVFGRWLSRGTKVLLLDEPTRGVDVGARHQIWQAVEAYAADGNSVVVICSELAELAVCHRVVVLVEGRDVAVLEGPGVTEEQMNQAIYSTMKETQDS
jgi:ABC-type sugar transport system ATPase subunit